MQANRLDIADVLRAMAAGETRAFPHPTAAVSVTKYGKDEFRVNGGLPTSYPNTVRLVRSLGIESATCPDCDGEGEAPRSMLGACYPCPTCEEKPSDFLRFAWREYASYTGAVSNLAVRLEEATRGVLNKQDREALARTMTRCSAGRVECGGVVVEWKLEDETRDVLYRVVA